MTANSNTFRYLAIAALIGVIIGSLLVWATVSIEDIDFNIKGTDSGKDGSVTLALAFLAIPCIFFQAKLHWLIWVGIALAALCAAVGIYDTIDIKRLADDAGTDFVKVKVGIGLWLVDLASIVATVAAFLSRKPTAIGTRPLTGGPAA